MLEHNYLPNIKYDSTKEIIVQILSKKWPLSLKELTIEINTYYRIRISTQAIYKVLNQLKTEKIIERIELKYKLDAKWIEKMQKLINSINQNYSD